MKFTGVQVFSATMARDRAELGPQITEWLAELTQTGGEVVDTIVTQSSDSQFHCLSIVMFYTGRAPRLPERSSRRG